MIVIIAISRAYDTLYCGSKKGSLDDNEGSRNIGYESVLNPLSSLNNTCQITVKIKKSAPNYVMSMYTMERPSCKHRYVMINIALPLKKEFIINCLNI